MYERPFMGMRAWAEARVGKTADRITIADVERTIPRRSDLPEPPFEDSLGGRVRFALRVWPSDEEATKLRLRAQHFREQTPES